MRLIKISEDTLINPEKISAISLKRIGGKRTFKVTVEGNSYVVETAPEDFLKEIIASGVEAHAQFFAG